MGPIERTLRRALAARLKTETRYRVAKQTGVSYQAISSFLTHEADMRLSSIEALCAYLGLEIAAKQRRSGRSAKAPAASL
jgi:DNA-binding phage protein